MLCLTNRFFGSSSQAYKSSSFVARADSRFRFAVAFRLLRRCRRFIADPIAKPKLERAEHIESAAKAAVGSSPRVVEHKPQLLEFGKACSEITPPEGYHAR